MYDYFKNKIYSILLIEDEELNQILVKHLLKEYNFNVDIANNGLEGIKMFKNKVYDFILMDIIMPIMDGLEASKKIRTLKSDLYVPIIAFTSDTITNYEDIFNEYGIDSCIDKPFETMNLFRILKKLNI